MQNYMSIFLKTNLNILIIKILAEIKRKYEFNI